MYIGCVIIILSCFVTGCFGFCTGQPFVSGNSVVIASSSWNHVNATYVVTNDIYHGTLLVAVGATNTSLSKTINPPPTSINNASSVFGVDHLYRHAYVWAGDPDASGDNFYKYALPQLTLSQSMTIKAQGGAPYQLLLQSSSQCGYLVSESGIYSVNLLDFKPGQFTTHKSNGSFAALDEEEASNGKANLWTLTEPTMDSPAVWTVFSANSVNATPSALTVLNTFSGTNRTRGPFFIDRQKRILYNSMDTYELEIWSIGNSSQPEFKLLNYTTVIRSALRNGGMPILGETYLKFPPVILGNYMYLAYETNTKAIAFTRTAMIVLDVRKNYSLRSFQRLPFYLLGSMIPLGTSIQGQSIAFSGPIEYSDPPYDWNVCSTMLYNHEY